MNGYLRGIGDVRAKISGCVKMRMKIGNLEMDESDFFILDETNDYYDCIIGSEFLRENGFEICPKENVVQIRDGNGYIKLSFKTSGELFVVLWDIWGDLVFVDLFKSQTPKEGACLDEHLVVERTSSPKQKHIDRIDSLDRIDR